MQPHAQASPRVFFVAHNRNHVRIFADAAAHLRTQGCDVVFACIDGHADREAAVKAATALSFEVIEASKLPHAAHAGDVVCVGNDWGPKAFLRTLDRLKRQGVIVFGMVEGARFAYPNHYRRVQHLMCWGPSALETLPGDKIVVGSPAIEAAVRPYFEPPERASILINYKFTRGSAELGPVWARAAAQAAEQAGAPYVISAHPLNVGELAGLNVSHEPFVSLLNEATLLVTRSSTAIYEALAARVSVIYAPIPDERRAEFGEPFGAFETAATEAELNALVAAHCGAPRFNDDAAKVFLARHIDMDPAKPSPQRIADAIQSRWREGAPAVSKGRLHDTFEAIRSALRLNLAGAAR